ncbi:hypothetical protein V8E51_002160 [Hyaloscypha variabilis]
MQGLPRGFQESVDLRFPDQVNSEGLDLARRTESRHEATAEPRGATRTQLKAVPRVDDDDGACDYVSQLLGDGNAFRSTVLQNSVSCQNCRRVQFSDSTPTIRLSSPSLMRCRTMICRTSMHGTPAARLPSSGPICIGPASAGHEGGRGCALASRVKSANEEFEKWQRLDTLHLAWRRHRLKEGNPESAGTGPLPLHPVPVVERDFPSGKSNSRGHEMFVVGRLPRSVRDPRNVSLGLENYTSCDKHGLLIANCLPQRGTWSALESALGNPGISTLEEEGAGRPHHSVNHPRGIAESEARGQAWGFFHFVGLVSEMKLASWDRNAKSALIALPPSRREKWSRQLVPRVEQRQVQRALRPRRRLHMPSAQLVPIDQQGRYHMLPWSQPPGRRPHKTNPKISQ